MNIQYNDLYNEIMNDKVQITFQSNTTDEMDQTNDVSFYKYFGHIHLWGTSLSCQELYKSVEVLIDFYELLIKVLFQCGWD